MRSHFKAPVQERRRDAEGLALLIVLASFCPLDVVSLRCQYECMSQQALFRTGPVFNSALHEVRGVNIVERASGRIVEPLQRVISLSGDAARLAQPINAVVSVINLGVSVASFAYMRSAFARSEASLDRVLDGISSLGMRMDARHRIEVFAEIGSTLDALALADNLAEDEARQLILANFVPFSRAIRIFKAYIKEASAAADATSGADLVEVLRLEAIVAMVEIKVLAAICRYADAAQRAEEHRGRMHEQVGAIGKTGLPTIIREAKDEADLMHRLQMLSTIVGVEPLHLLVAHQVASRELFSGLGSPMLRVSISTLETAAVIRKQAEGMALETSLLDTEPTLLARLLDDAGTDPLNKDLRLFVLPTDN